MKRFLKNGLLTLALSAPAIAGAADIPKSDKPPKPNMGVKVPEYNLNSKDFIFPSGIRIIMQADHSQPVVGVTMYLDRGSSDDPVGKEGIAHFVEHLWFRSEHGDLPKIWNVLSDLGCGLNASTADDWTNYMSVCPSTSLESLMRLESLRLAAPVRKVSEETVNIEREVIRNELRMRKENGFQGALPYIIEKLYPPDHPYARGGIGSHESLNNIKLADIQKFTEDHYRPENTTIVVVGDFDPDNAAQIIYENFDPTLLFPDRDPKTFVKYKRPSISADDFDPNNEAHLISWPSQDPADPDSDPLWAQLPEPPKRVDGPPPVPPQPNDTKISYHQAPVARRTVVVAWTMPGAYRGDDAKIQAAANLAGNFMIQYLDDQPWTVKNSFGSSAEASGCFAWQSEHDTKIICLTEVKDSWADKVDGEYVANRLLDQVATIWDADIRTPQEGVPGGSYLAYYFNNSKQGTLAQIFQGLDLFAALYGRQTQIASHAHYTGSHKYHSDLMNNLMKLEAEEVSTMAYQYLKRDRAVRVVLDPIPEDERVLDSSDSEYHGATRDSDMLHSVADPKAITPEVVLDNMVLPPIDDITDVTLDNGLRVVIMPHGEVPIVQTSLLFNGGQKTEPLGLDLAAQYWSTSIYDDAHNPLQIAGQWTNSYQDDWTQRGVRASSGNVDGALWLLREHVDNLKTDFNGKYEDLRDEKKFVLSDWGNDAWWENKVTWEHLNPDHPSNWNADIQEWERIGKIPPSDIKAYLAKKYQPKNATLLIVGDVQNDSALELAKKFFAGWQSTVPKPEFAEMLPPNPPKQSTPIYVFDDPKNTQTNVRFACRVKDATEAERARVQVLGDALDERAWQILREQSGVTYGAGAGAWTFKNGTAYLYLNSLVQNDSAVLAVNTFRTLVDETTKGAFKEDRVRLLKYNRAKKYVTQQQSIEQMHNRLRSTIVEGKADFGAFEAYAKALSEVTGKDLTEAIGDCQSNHIITIRGPKKFIEPTFKEAGIEYEILDWDAMGDELYAAQDPKGYKKYKKKQAKAEKKAAKEDAKEGGEEGDEETKEE